MGKQRVARHERSALTPSKETSISFRSVSFVVEMRAKLSLILLLATALLVGCESWYARNLQETVSWKRPVASAMQRLRMLPDSVMLEIAVVKIDRSEIQRFDELWNQIDTGSLSLSERRILDQNGVRVGVVPSHIPADLHALMAPIPVDQESLNSWEEQLFEKGLLKPEPRILLHDGIQNRRGEVHPVPVSGWLNQASWIVEVGDQRIAGASDNVRAVMEVRTFPKGDGTVRLVCTPALHIGQPRTQIGIQQQGFAYETAQEKKQLRELKFGACLRSGETLLVAPTSDVSDLGGLFFGPPDEVVEGEGDGTFRILMLRLLQTQRDDLFDAESDRDELTTTFVD